MTIAIDSEKGKRVAKSLYNCFSIVGIHGKKDMPEDETPNNLENGSLEHALFITLTVAIDYMRDANSLWESSRLTFDDQETRYLFYPELLNETNFSKVVSDMQKYNLSKKPQKDASIWRTIGVTLYKKWKGNLFNFLENCKWDSIVILRHLKNDNHIYKEKTLYDFPYLRGPKIGPLWLRMLRDNVGITKLRNLEKLPIPIDIHVARATLATGVVRGKYMGKIEGLFDYIREAWSRSVEGLNIKSRPMMALDLDEPLWHLSKYGCTKRSKNNESCPVYHNCETKEFCVKGKVCIEKRMVDLNT